MCGGRVCGVVSEVVVRWCELHSSSGKLLDKIVNLTQCNHIDQYAQYKRGEFGEESGKYTHHTKQRGRVRTPDSAFVSRYYWYECNFPVYCTCIPGMTPAASSCSCTSCEHEHTTQVCACGVCVCVCVCLCLWVRGVFRCGRNTFEAFGPYVIDVIFKSTAFTVLTALSNCTFILHSKWKSSCPVRVCVCACVSDCVFVRARACVCVCLCVCGNVRWAFQRLGLWPDHPFCAPQRPCPCICSRR